MATFTTNPIRIEDIRTAVLDYLKANNPNNGDFDFDGQNLGYIIDAVSYVTMLLSYQNTQEANNIFLDTTEIRKNAVSISKPMGYRPKRKISSRFSGEFEYLGDSDGQFSFPSDATITIPSKTVFTSNNGYKFVNTEAIVLRKDNDVLLNAEFIIYEGEFEYLTIFGTGEKLQKHVINSLDVEESNLTVSIRPTNTTRSSNVPWTYAPSFFTTEESKVYYVEEDIKDEYKPIILFGDGTLGQIPTINETIEVEYLKTRGVSGNGETALTLDDASGITTTGAGWSFDESKLTLVIPTGQTSFGGSDAEDITNINFNANRFYAAGGRGVIKDDIISLLAQNSASLLYYNVVGGNELFPDDATKRGITYISAVPASLNEDSFLTNATLYLSEVEELQLRNILDAATVIATNRVFLKPSYVYIDLSPLVEVSDTNTTAETEAILSNVSISVTAYYDDNIKGLGKPLKFDKLLASVTNTAGVISADIEMTHNFIITYDSFFNTKETLLHLPVLFAKDTSGKIIYDNNNSPTFTTFIKKRSDVIDSENKLRAVESNYTQFTLPVETSPLYGLLTHEDSNRELYNIDVSNIRFITFEMLGTGSAKVLSFESSKFKNEDAIEFIPNLYEIFDDASTTKWQIQLSSRSIGVLARDKSSGLFSIESEDDDYLTTTVGVQTEDTTSDNPALIQLNAVEETSSTGVKTKFNELAFLVENKNLSDVRIYAKTKIADIILDITTYAWALTNTKTFQNETIKFQAGVSTPDNITVQVDDNGTVSDLMSIEHVNGVFNVIRSSDDLLALATQRNDILLEPEYLLKQEENAIDYEFSKINSSIDGLQEITLNEYKSLTMETLNNNTHRLNDTYFSLQASANETTGVKTNFLIFFVSTGAGSSTIPDNSNNDTLITVTLANNDDANTVASKMLTALEANTIFDAEIGVTRFTNILTLTWKRYGKNTDPFDGPNTGGIDRRTNFITASSAKFFDLITSGASTSTANIDNISIGDFIQLTDTSNTTELDNQGIFQVADVTSANGCITVYNRRGINNIFGEGTIEHFVYDTTDKSGVFGQFSIYTYDYYHDVSVGTLNYNTGELTFNQTLKGFTDLENNKAIINSVKEIFNNYGGNGAEMDKIRLTPIDNYSSTGFLLGQNNSIDSRFDQYIKLKVANPILK